MVALERMGENASDSRDRSSSNERESDANERAAIFESILILVVA
jgi:hypothetical protein